MTQQKSTDPSEPTADDFPEVLTELNDAAREIEKAVHQIEEFLEIRNPAVSAWVTIKSWNDQSGEYGRTQLGYDLFGYHWHIGIREIEGHENFPEEATVKTWRFTQSPRKLRISAVEKLPDLVDELTKEARRTARRLREKTVEVQAFAESLKTRLRSKAAKKGDAS
jgi:hypothetical protein